MVRRFLIALETLLASVALFLLVLLLGMRAKSPFALRTLRAFNRWFTNPRQMTTAGRPGAYAGVIRHVGRRSGAACETPVGPFVTDAGFVIAIAYGTSSDWSASSRRCAFAAQKPPKAADSADSRASLTIPFSRSLGPIGSATAPSHQSLLSR